MKIIYKISVYFFLGSCIAIVGVYLVLLFQIFPMIGNHLAGQDAMILKMEILKKALIFIFPPIMLSALGVFFILNEFFIKPIHKINDSAIQISKGDFNVNLDINTKNEIGTLAKNIIKMGRKLQKHVKTLEDEVQRKTKKLEEKVKKEEKTTEAMLYILERAKRNSNQLRANQNLLKNLNKDLEITVKENEHQKKMLISKNKELKHLDIMKSEFLSNASHELRTPLTSIKMYNQLMFDKALGPLTPNQVDALSEILQATDHLIQVVNDILDIKKMESGKMKYNFEPNKIDEVIDNALVNLKAFINDHEITVNVKIKSKLQEFRFDKMRITEVVQNLLSNAVKYNKDNNPITIEVSKIKSVCVLKVIDRGIGMKKIDMKRLFNKFYQVDASITREIEGTGLGLAICKEIVDAHKGKIKVESKVGEGTTFEVSLPV